MFQHLKEKVEFNRLFEDVNAYIKSRIETFLLYTNLIFENFTRNKFYFPIIRLFVEQITTKKV